MLIPLLPAGLPLPCPFLFQISVRPHRLSCGPSRTRILPHFRCASGALFCSLRTPSHTGLAAHSFLSFDLFLSAPGRLSPSPLGNTSLLHTGPLRTPGAPSAPPACLIASVPGSCFLSCDSSAAAVTLPVLFRLHELLSLWQEEPLCTLTSRSPRALSRLQALPSCRSSQSFLAICLSILHEDCPRPHPPTLQSLQETAPSSMAVPSCTLPAPHPWGLGISNHPFPWEAPSPTVGKGGRASPSGPPCSAAKEGSSPSFPQAHSPFAAPTPEGGAPSMGGRVLAALSPLPRQGSAGNLVGGSWEGGGVSRRGWRSRWAPPRPLPLVVCPPSAGGLRGARLSRACSFWMGAAGLGRVLGVGRGEER